MVLTFYEVKYYFCVFPNKVTIKRQPFLEYYCTKNVKIYR